jgi:hypothetical protein
LCLWFAKIPADCKIQQYFPSLIWYNSGHHLLFVEVKWCKLLGAFRVCGVNLVGENVFGMGAGDGDI